MHLWARDPAKHPTRHRRPPRQQRTIYPKMSTVLRLKNRDLESSSHRVFFFFPKASAKLRATFAFSPANAMSPRQDVLGIFLELVRKNYRE